MRDKTIACRQTHRHVDIDTDMLIHSTRILLHTLTHNTHRHRHRHRHTDTHIHTHTYIHTFTCCVWL